jgi:3-oxoacyl-[acyl-carrier protein] reductase
VNVYSVRVTYSPASNIQRPVALITGVGRSRGIGFAVAQQLAKDGFDVATCHWSPYDRRLFPDDEDGFLSEVVVRLESLGARSTSLEIDFERTDVVTPLFDQVEEGLGAISALIMCHCESVDSGILNTTVDSFDRHFAVNARATWLLIREFGLRFRSTFGSGRIVALTSDHTVGNLPYGASKAALDRITIAAAREFATKGITANVINPGPTDTGWMTPSLKSRIVNETPLDRIGTPEDAARLVSFLCSPEGQWVNGQLLHSDGGVGS